MERRSVSGDGAGNAGPKERRRYSHPAAVSTSVWRILAMTLFPFDILNTVS
jgi:hypothetical protein